MYLQFKLDWQKLVEPLLYTYGAVQFSLGLLCCTKANKIEDIKYKRNKTKHTMHLTQVQWPGESSVTTAFRLCVTDDSGLIGARTRTTATWQGVFHSNFHDSKRYHLTEGSL